MKSTKKKIKKPGGDLQESENDKKHLRPDEATIDLPDVRDIPGQEHVRVPNMNEFADTTISSDDEEGLRVFDEENTVSDDSNVTKEERLALRDAAQTTAGVKDEENLKQAQLDNVDEDGESLNEKVNVSGSDMDIPGSEEDDKNEEIGEEDEENNSYSLDGEDEDDSISK